MKILTDAEKTEIKIAVDLARGYWENSDVEKTLVGRRCIKQILDKMKASYQYKEVVIDQGFDISTKAEKSGVKTTNLVNQKHHRPDMNFEEFLNVPNGNTVATFVSGSGIAAETFLDEFYSILEDAMFEQYFQYLSSVSTTHSNVEFGYFADMASDQFADSMVFVDVLERFHKFPMSKLLDYGA